MAFDNLPYNTAVSPFKFKFDAIGRITDVEGGIKQHFIYEQDKITALSNDVDEWDAKPAAEVFYYNQDKETFKEKRTFFGGSTTPYNATPYLYNNAKQLTTINLDFPTTYTYDAAGNIATAHQIGYDTYKYTYTDSPFIPVMEYLFDAPNIFSGWLWLPIPIHPQKNSLKRKEHIVNGVLRTDETTSYAYVYDKSGKLDSIIMSYSTNEKKNQQCVYKLNYDCK